MSRELKIASGLSLPRTAVTSTIVVYGGKGMGKTNLGGVLVEEFTKMGDRWCVLDPMGVWWGLRHSLDGKGPGIECVILGGAHGDIPIEPTGGAIVADLVIDENANTIIDFSRKANGQMWTVGEKIKFVTDYTLRLFQRQGELIDGKRREPLMQILDESARYIPQVIPSGAIDLAKCVGAWEQVCEEGRNIGLGVTFLTQRSARMNKSVSELADVMFAFRTIGPNSLRAVMDWLGEHVEKSHVKDLAEKVRSLDIGQALVVSPGWLKIEKIASIRMRETFDSSATPKPGQRQQRVTGKASKPDLTKYQARMAATIEKTKADDPKLLHKEIQRLNQELKKKGDPVKSGYVEVDIMREVKHAVMARDREWSLEMKKGNTEIQRLAGVIKKVKQALGDTAAPDALYATMQMPGTSVLTQSNVKSVIEHAARAIEATTRPVAVPSVPVESGEITGPEQKILNSIAWCESIGIKAPAQELVCFLSGYQHVRSTGYTNPRGYLNTKGLIKYSRDAILFTERGRELAEAPSRPLTTEELHKTIMEKLDGPEKKLLQPLLDAYPESMRQEDLCREAGYQHVRSTGYTNPRGRLNTWGLIAYDKESIRATDILFI
jgi:hypothetical protein